MNVISLENQECAGIEALLDHITAQYSSVEDEQFMKDAPVFAHELPRRVRAFLNDFRALEPASGTCMITGYEVDQVKIGPTPEHWQLEPEISPVLREEILLILFGSLLGEPIAWATQQKGHIVHDIMPIKGMEQEQLGTGSEQLLWWHNEDAFHPYRGDYLSMMCLRNPDKVATTLASIDTVELSEEQIKLLFEPQFVIRPDESHLKKNAAQIDGDESAEDLLCSAYQGIERMNSAPEKISVLYGSPSSPYLRIDPYFMDAVDDEAAQSALDALIKSIDEVLVDVVLKPGELLFIDNYKTVHGRKPFKAKYDGNDRWLKRINITKDLRKSRNARTSCLSRVIY